MACILTTKKKPGEFAGLLEILYYVTRSLPPMPVELPQKQHANNTDSKHQADSICGVFEPAEGRFTISYFDVTQRYACTILRHRCPALPQFHHRHQIRTVPSPPE
jgi:hypothetical protein